MLRAGGHGLGAGARPSDPRRLRALHALALAVAQHQSPPPLRATRSLH